jgi:hypothetical protein
MRGNLRLGCACRYCRHCTETTWTSVPDDGRGHSRRNLRFTKPCQIGGHNRSYTDRDTGRDSWRACSAGWSMFVAAPHRHLPDSARSRVVARPGEERLHLVMRSVRSCKTRKTSHRTNEITPSFSSSSSTSASSPISSRPIERKDVVSDDLDPDLRRAIEESLRSQQVTQPTMRSPPPTSSTSPLLRATSSKKEASASPSVATALSTDAGLKPLGGEQKLLVPDNSILVVSGAGGEEDATKRLTLQNYMGLKESPLTDVDPCLVCLERERNVMFPCGHRTHCLACNETLNVHTCLKCRAPATTLLVVQ